MRITKRKVNRMIQFNTGAKAYKKLDHLVDELFDLGFCDGDGTIKPGRGAYPARPRKQVFNDARLFGAMLRENGKRACRHLT